MAVYIENMEKPKKCNYCPCFHFAHSDDVWVCEAVSHNGTFVSRSNYERDEKGTFDPLNDCPIVEVPKQKWIWCEDSLPNEDEIAYTTMVNVSGERDISDKVLVCDTDLNIYAAYFIHTGTPHKYYGTCLTNEYTLMHSRIGQAGWQCTENKYGWSKRIDAIAWVPLPEL